MASLRNECCFAEILLDAIPDRPSLLDQPLNAASKAFQIMTTIRAAVHPLAEKHLEVLGDA